MNKGLNLLDIPTYSPIMAARLVKLSPERVRRWLRGYHYKYEFGLNQQIERRYQRPLFHREGTAGSPYASFLDLIDLLFVKKFIENGISIQKLRKALDEAEHLFGQQHFAHNQFWTDGKNIYIEIQKKSDKSKSLMQLLSKGQWVIAPIIRQIAYQIEFDNVSGIAEKWFPLGRQKHVVIDPRIAFGSPSIINRGIKTANIYDLYVAENNNLGRVCSWLEIEENEVLSAVRFEEQLMQAA